MTARELRRTLLELDPDTKVRVIVDGKYDLNPTWNVCKGIGDCDEIWIEGVSNEKEEK
jgi:hypothetical protein